MALNKKIMISKTFVRPVRVGDLYYIEVKRGIFGAWKVLKTFPYRTEEGAEHFAKEFTRRKGFLLSARTERSHV